jgi:membrane protein implicated in regulation of membrane protease activity
MPKITGLWMGIIAIILGVLILAIPDAIRLILGIGLIVVGILAVLRKWRHAHSHCQTLVFPSPIAIFEGPYYT